MALEAKVDANLGNLGSVPAMTNTSTLSGNISDQTALNIHSAEIISGLTKKFIIKDRNTAISRADADVIV